MFKYSVKLHCAASTFLKVTPATSFYTRNKIKPNIPLLQFGFILFLQFFLFGFYFHFRWQKARLERFCYLLTQISFICSEQRSNYNVTAYLSKYKVILSRSAQSTVRDCIPSRTTEWICTKRQRYYFYTIICEQDQPKALRNASLGLSSCTVTAFPFSQPHRLTLCSNKLYLCASLSGSQCPRVADGAGKFPFLF